MTFCHRCAAPLEQGDRFCARCGATTSIPERNDPLLGRTIAGSYVILELIGVGGMGRVYRAEQTTLGRTVAIKVVHPHLLGDEPSVARFYTEARATSRLNHPNSVSIIDFGRTEDGVLYLVMEYLRGKDLSRVMHEEGPLPIGRICDMLVGVLAALEEAHELGIVHRDLKPENIIVDRTRTGADFVKVVDFGLAKVVGGGTRTSITSPGLVCGTPDYMAPEQGRGEEVDGRGDLYSLGVMLFELLTEKLPFGDETPAKVVLRHSTDPVPDPRVHAPHRGIPAAVAEVCMKAMAKTPEERFATASEMATAIRRVSGSLRPPARGEVICAACATPNPPSQRFCGSCGGKLESRPSMPITMRPTSIPSEAPPSEARTGLIGRGEEIAKLAALHEMATQKAIGAQLIGDPGVGKTRLLSEAVARALEAGDMVASSGPHPTGAPVPYVAIRPLLASLLAVEQSALLRVATEGGAFLDPVSRAGIQELVQPTGLIGFEGISRTAAVASALSMAVRVACARAPSGRVVLVVDELHRIDDLSVRVLRELVRVHEGGGLFLLTAGVRALEGVGAERFQAIPLRGFSAEEAHNVLSLHLPETEALPLSLRDDGRTYLPLYVEQLRALGYSLADEGRPMRLADAVVQRIERLDPNARRLLQAAAVLGDRCALPALHALVDAAELSALERLQKRGLVIVLGDEVAIVHPYVRDLVEASIPAEARKALHEQALAVASSMSAPIEVRSEHAFRGPEPVSAMVLLERMGEAALSRADAQVAILAFRRGVDVARREMLDTGDDSLERAVATFSRKLGEALWRAGDFAEAEGVLREALDLTGAVSTDRARLLLVLGRVVAARERRRDAQRLLGQALDIAVRANDASVTAHVQLALAELRQEDGDHLGAANALTRAVELLADSGAPGVRRASAIIKLGEALADLGDGEEATVKLEEGYELALGAEAPALAAQARGTLASIEELGGNRDSAGERYREAAVLAASAGDSESQERWRRAAYALNHTTGPRPPA